MARDSTMARIRQLETVMNTLIERFVALEKQYDPQAIRKAAMEAVYEDRAVVQKTADDAVKVLNFLCSKGVIDRSELNEALK